VTSDLSLDSIVTASRDQLSTSVADEAVILGMTDGVYYGLDPVGARIWRLLERPIRLSNVVDVLVTEYDVERERCAADLLVLATDLLTRGLLEVHDVRSDC
jgi:hypothetical protein